MCVIPSNAVVALTSAVPTLDDVAEVGVARQPLSYGAAADGRKSNDAVVEFTLTDATTIAGVSVFDAETDGNVVWCFGLAAPREAQQGDLARFAPGALSHTLR